jgi:hypothetical protein
VVHVHVHMSYDAVDATSTRQSAAPAPMRLAAVKRSGAEGAGSVALPSVARRQGTVRH